MKRVASPLAVDRLDAVTARAIAAALVRRHGAARRLPDAEPGALLRAHALQEAAARLAATVGKRAVEPVIGLALAFLAQQADRLLARAGDDRILEHTTLLGLDSLRAVEGASPTEVAVEPTAHAPPGGADDAVLEIAGLSLDLMTVDRVDLGERLISHYAGEADDQGLYAVLGYHEAVATIRRALRWMEDGGEGTGLDRPAAEAERMLSMVATARRPPTPPSVIALSGPVASGKSTLACALADHLGTPRTVADRIRDHLVRGVAGRPVHEAGWAEGLEPGFGPRIYSELLSRAEVVLQAGRGIVLDAGFPTPREREAARSLARRYGLPFRFVRCHVDRETQRRRLADRDDADGSGRGWRDIADAYASHYVPPDELAAEERIEVDTTRSSEDALRDVLAALVRSGLFI